MKVSDETGMPRDTVVHDAAGWLQELAVMVARSRDGSVLSFPVTETVHRNSICYITQTPAAIPEEVRAEAQRTAEKAVACLEGPQSPGTRQACEVDGNGSCLGKTQNPYNVASATQARVCSAWRCS